MIIRDVLKPDLPVALDRTDHDRFVGSAVRPPALAPLETSNPRLVHFDDTEERGAGERVVCPSLPGCGGKGARQCGRTRVPRCVSSD